MKINRLIGIIMVLLQKEKVTAAYLASKFEVSKRTINRDIEDICIAGIPIVTLQGSGGGITLAEGYSIDKAIFSKTDLSALFAALAGLDSVSYDAKYQNIIDKFFPGKDKVCTDNHILIDLASHYKSSLAPKISAFQEAIDDLVTVKFTYYSSSGQRRVLFDPYLVVFRWSDWYAFGYDHTSGGFRLFKLNRLWELQAASQHYQPRDIPDGTLDFDRYFADEIQAVIIFEESVKYRLIEEYGIDCFSVLPGGKLRFEFSFTNKNYLMEWLLGFGSCAELISPKELRLELAHRLGETLKIYTER